MDNLILVAFGKQRLVDLIEKINTDKEDELLNLALGGQAPPVYRPEKHCNEEEILSFLEFTSWLSNMLKMYAELKKEN